MGCTPSRTTAMSSENNNDVPQAKPIADHPKQSSPPPKHSSSEPEAKPSKPEPIQEESEPPKVEENTSPVEKEKEDEKQPDPYYDLILDEDVANNTWPKKMEDIHKADKQSLMAQVMTREIFESLKDHKTKNGWTISRAINTGVTNPTSFMGCHAGDLESYNDFKPLFQGVIEKYHKGFSMETMKHVTDMDVNKIPSDLEDHAKDRIISTRIRCARNLSFFPLNTCGTKETRLEIASLMEKVFETLPEDLQGTFYRHTTMTEDEIKGWVDKHFLFRGKDKMQAASGYHVDWPHGRGIFVSKDEHFLLWLNEGDHLRIISMQQDGDVKQVFDRLSRGVKAIEDGLKKVTGKDQVFMRDDVLGMITCCPTNLGTAMRGGVHIMIPKLIKKIGFEEIDKIAREMNCQARGSSGEHSEVVDRVDLSNWRRLGYPEYELVEDMIKCVNKFSEMEAKA